MFSYAFCLQSLGAIQMLWLSMSRRRLNWAYDCHSIMWEFSREHNYVPTTSKGYSDFVADREDVAAAVVGH